jgi:predicted dinucleotide-binding enzyme
MNKRRLDIVGAGKVGKTLARLWNQNGVFEIGSVANRSLESSEEAIAKEILSNLL